MSSSHWSKNLPYLVPNWDGLGDDDRIVETRNNMEPNHELSLSGIGVYDGVSHKEIRKCNYLTKECSLPFWVNYNRKPDSLPFLNTMCVSSTKRLFSYSSNTIRSLQLNLDSSKFQNDDEFSFDKNFPHNFSYDQISKFNPFAWNSSSFLQHPLGKNLVLFFFYFLKFYFVFRGTHIGIKNL